MRHPILRITFLLFTIAAIVSFPFVVQLLDSPRRVGLSQLPFAVQQIDGSEDEAAAEIQVNAPDSCEIGELVRIDLTGSNCDGFKWSVIPESTDFEVVEDGNRAFFSSREPGSYLIIIAGARVGSSVPSLVYHTLTVEGEVGPPTPENLTSKVTRWSKSIKDYPLRKGHVAAVAQVFRKLGTADDVTVDQILEATATANSAVLGESLEVWISFLEPLGEELDKLTEAGGLSTREQYKDVWLKIAEGLEKGI